MKVNELKKNKLEREYEVTVDAATVKRKVEEQLKSIGNRVKIPGFRPGHVPVKILQQRYGQSIMGEVLEKTVNATSSEVLKEKGERPALQPQIEITSFEEGKELQYKMKYEVLPEIPTTDFGSLSLEKMRYTVPDKDIEDSLKRLAEQRKSYNAKEASAAASLGDAVKIDFVGSIDGTKFDGGAGEGFTLELGSGQFIPGFEEQLVGAKAGDSRTVKVPFPKDYHKDDLAGKEAEFAVTVHEVLGAEAVSVDEDFAKGLGVKGLQELKDAVREQIGRDYEQMSRSKLKKNLFDQLDSIVKFDAPQTMIDMEFKSIWERLQEAKKQGDESVDKPDEELKSEYTAIAERRVRLGLLLAEVGRANNLKVTQDELSRAVMDQARMFPGQEKMVFEHYQKNPQQLEELRGPILEEKAVDFILGKAKVSDKDVTIDELMRDDDDTSAKKPAEKPAKTESGEKKAAKKSADKPAAEKPTAKKPAKKADK